MIYNHVLIISGSIMIGLAELVGERREGDVGRFMVRITHFGFAKGTSACSEMVPVARMTVQSGLGSPIGCGVSRCTGRPLTCGGAGGRRWGAGPGTAAPGTAA